jgi:hypothetical protein
MAPNLIIVVALITIGVTALLIGVLVGVNKPRRDDD